MGLMDNHEKSPSLMPKVWPQAHTSLDSSTNLSFRKHAPRMTKLSANLAERLARIDFPHTRNGQVWDRESKTFQRLLNHAERLESLGMSVNDISFMLRDLYWDAFSEFHFKDITRGQAGAPTTPVRKMTRSAPVYKTPAILRNASPATQVA